MRRAIRITIIKSPGNTQKKIPKAATVPASAFEISFSVFSASTVLPYLEVVRSSLAAAIIRAVINTKKNKGNQANPQITGPIGSIQKLPAQAAKKGLKGKPKDHDGRDHNKK